MISQYFHRKAKVQSIDTAQAVLDILPPEYDKAFFKTVEDLRKTVDETINFYDKLPEDMEKAFKSLLKFVFRLDEAERSN